MTPQSSNVVRDEQGQAGAPPATGATASLAELASGGSAEVERHAPTPEFDVEIRLYQEGDWEKHRADFLRIEEEVFRPTKKPDGSGGGYSTRRHEGTIKHPGSVTVLMFDKRTDTLIGYTNTAPSSEDTHYIDNTAIDLAYQGHGLIKELMDKQEQELIDRGVKYVTRDSRNYDPDESGRTYADKVIARALARGRFVSADEHDSDWGPQVDIKMTLKDGEGSYER